MIPFVDYTSFVQGAIGVYTAILFLASVLLIILELLHRHSKSIVGLVPIGIVLYMMFEYICDILSNTDKSALIQAVENCLGRIPGVLWICLLLVITVLEIWLFHQNRKWKKSHITSFSIKEAIDNLPVGICCYEANGQIMLKNTVMEQVCRGYTGEALLNAVSFRNAVCSGNEPTENSAIIKLDNGKVFVVSDASFSAEVPSLCILTATDITEQYKNTQTLAAQQELVVKLNEELVKYGKQIVSSITAREVLNAKVKLHDELGSNLLAVKRYILSGGTAEDRVAIENALHKNLQYLKHETEHTVRDEYAVILETAEKLDIRTKIIGTVTEREPQRHVIVTGIHECLTNTIRHAEGDELTVRLTETDDAFWAEFTNNGNPPQGEVKERGGLALLRALTEKSGGTMQITSKPKFVLTLKLPKEETDHVL